MEKAHYFLVGKEKAEEMYEEQSMKVQMLKAWITPRIHREPAVQRALLKLEAT